MSSVVEALEREFGLLPRGLGDGSLAATAFELARQLDDPSNSATSKSMCARALVEVKDKLDAIAGASAAEVTDGVDDLAARRDKRRKRTAGT